VTPDAHIPLFPLHTVLVPGGRLPLRIFEPRYIDLVRECTRDDGGFGVCLLLPDPEGGEHHHHSRIGTLARIIDFYTLDDGLLGITARGHERFQILSTSVRDNGLLVGDVTWLAEPRKMEVPDECALLSDIAARFMDRVSGNYPEHEPEDLQKAGWVSYRLTEWLPLEPIEKQVLLELNDPVQRLKRLLHQLPDQLPGDE
jgi:Lon protease-like protein